MPIAPATISPRRPVPAHIDRPEYVDQLAPLPFRGPEVKDADTIARMRVAGRLAAQALQLVGKHVAPGITTDELDAIGHEFLVENGAYPSTLGYRGFPKSLCTSVNEVICHGIPDSRVIESYAKRFGYGVVREFTGHGIGTSFHSGLIVPHFDSPEHDTLIEPGMTFTIEPMLCLGTREWEMWDDDWTVVTKDGRPSAQFEHTLLVTDSGAEILTLP